MEHLATILRRKTVPLSSLPIAVLRLPQATTCTSGREIAASCSPKESGRSVCERETETRDIPLTGSGAGPSTSKHVACPCREASVREERSLPERVEGPVEYWGLAWLAAARAWQFGTVQSGMFWSSRYSVPRYHRDGEPRCVEVQEAGKRAGTGYVTAEAAIVGRSRRCYDQCL